MTSTPEDAELLKLCEKPLHEMNSHHVLTVQTALKSRLLSPAIGAEVVRLTRERDGAERAMSEEAQKSVDALMRAITAEASRDEALRNARTPGTVEVCEYAMPNRHGGQICSNEAMAGWDCKRATCPIKATPTPPGAQPVARRQRDPGCATCQSVGHTSLAPPHDASPRCESGKHPHCSCDICF